MVIFHSYVSLPEGIIPQKFSQHLHRCLTIVGAASHGPLGSKKNQALSHKTTDMISEVQMLGLPSVVHRATLW